MNLHILLEFVRKDVKIYFADPNALAISFAVPVFIASFLAIMTGGMASSGGPPKKAPLIVADLDGSDLSKAVVKDLVDSPMLSVKVASEAEARDSVKKGDYHVGLLIPKGFAVAAVAPSGSPVRPELPLLFDPSDNITVQAVRGGLTQSVMSVISKAKYGAFAPTELPFKFKEQPQAAGDAEATAQSSASAHSFAGMAVQGLLFFAIEAAMAMMRERKMGIWKRLRATPVPSATLILGRVISSTIRALAILLVVFAFGAAIFGFRVQGSWLGFLAICLCVAVMASSFGLLVAALGRTEQQSRGLSVLAVLAMLMLGGAWWPAFLMPDWLQKVGLFIPVRWAVDGFDNVIWRGQGFGPAAISCAALLGFSVLFAAYAVRRFSFETADAS